MVVLPVLLLQFTTVLIAMFLLVLININGLPALPVVMAWVMLMPAEALPLTLISGLLPDKLPKLPLALPQEPILFVLMTQTIAIPALMLSFTIPVPAISVYMPINISLQAALPVPMESPIPLPVEAPPPTLMSGLLRAIPTTLFII